MFDVFQELIFGFLRYKKTERASRTTGTVALPRDFFLLCRPTVDMTIVKTSPDTLYM